MTPTEMALSTRWRAIVKDPRFAEFEGLAPTCRVVLVADLEAALAIIDKASDASYSQETWDVEEVGDALFSVLREAGEVRLENDRWVWARESALRERGQEGIELARELMNEKHEDETCYANRDGECYWSGCPQLRDNEPVRTGRHCPLDKPLPDPDWPEKIQTAKEARAAGIRIRRSGEKS
jgi:hypothetical protein